MGLYSGVAISVLASVAGIIVGLQFNPFAGWWYGGISWIIVAILSVVLSAIAFPFFGEPKNRLSVRAVLQGIVALILIPVFSLMVAGGTLLGLNVIFSVILAILGIRSFLWTTSGLIPAESERFAASAWAVIMSIGGIVVTVVIGVLISAFAIIVLMGVLALLQPEDKIDAPNTKISSPPPN